MSDSLGPRPPITRMTKALYGFGSIAYGVKDNGFKVFLLLFYNQIVGMDAYLVGLAIMIAMLIDSLIDPVIGEFSDNLRSAWGRRHPLMYASAIPAGLSFLLLWNPPVGWSEQALFFYLIAVAVICRTFITLYEIPSSSLAAELTEDYDERTSILGWRTFFAWWGGLSLTIVMFTVFLQPSDKYPIGQLNRDGYSTYGLAAAALMTVSILGSALGTHRFIPWLRKPTGEGKRGLLKTLKDMGATLSNRSFFVITMVGIVAAAAQGVGFSLAFYFSTYFWELSSDQTAILQLDSFISSAIALSAAPYLSKKHGKKVTGSLLLVASVLVGFIPMGLRLLGYFPDNGHPSIVPILFMDGLIRGALGITASVLIAAMLADVVEDSEVKTGRRSEGLFFAFTSLVQKAVSGVGVVFATMILTAIQFPRDAKPGEVPTEVIHNLALVYMPIIAVLYGLAVIILQAYSISRATHTENLKTLAERAAANS